ncbi:DUF1289 domain-containing protein [Ketobacter sp. MCCC 1A13808]|uniref:DUF1289 domain-containing protein n=1 Tax=Ketobacter sp. MCCC 1A13808 TaxID=2602738 RepID=UPI000F1F99DB|nr:DUF1289 domain-containing protein [Ketobacter sp. MCCC 1A13808]MVF13279.1 DUF1289 domain-containing protein [Ketobacter sp. MCCC 1A13808]RLP54269.1 MAG: DUF1289 domain-containing protein [Ketobacter sp.]
MSDTTPKSIQSPCVRNCCLNTDDVCLGCGRTLDEIRAWSALSNAERHEVLQRSEHRRRQIQTNWRL